MFQENEVLALVLGCGAGIFLLIERQSLRALPKPGLLIAAYFSFMVAATATVAEGFFLFRILDGVEHVTHSVTALLLLLWCALYAMQTGRPHVGGMDRLR